MYYNSCIFFKDDYPKKIEDFIDVYKWCGYQKLFLEFDSDFAVTIDFINVLKEIRNKFDMIAAAKLVIKSDSLKEIKKKINIFSQYKDFILTIESNNLDVLSFAAHDSRVDIIKFTKISNIKSLTPGILSILKQSKSQKFLEISLLESLNAQKKQRSKYFREINKVIHLALKNPQLLIYSGNENNFCDIRGPREYISVFNSIFSIPLANSKRILRENPALLMQKVNKRIQSENIEDGIKIINRISKNKEK